VAASLKLALILGACLILFSNGLALFLRLTGFDRQYFYVPLSVILLSAICVWAKNVGGVSLRDIGLTLSGILRSVLIGLVVGMVMAGPALVFLGFPVLLDTPPNYVEIDRLSVAGFVWRVGVEATIATALTEEIIFRGVLQTLFARSLGIVRAVTATTIVFVLWHLVTNALTLGQNTVTLPLLPSTVSQALGYFGSLLVVGVAGLVFSIVRIRIGSLVGSVMAHWVSVAAITIFLFMRHQFA
jgi:membrane protease YdiL (CAAX protease family)